MQKAAFPNMHMGNICSKTSQRVWRNSVVWILQEKDRILYYVTTLVDEFALMKKIR